MISQPQLLPGSDPQWEKVDVGAVTVERVREFGEVYLPLVLWNRLGLGKLLEELIEPGRETVGWATVASVLVAARFCAQRSELGIAEDAPTQTRNPEGIRYAQFGENTRSSLPDLISNSRQNWIAGRRGQKHLLPRFPRSLGALPLQRSISSKRGI